MGLRCFTLSIFALVLGGLLLACSPAWGQASEVFNRYSVQPEVWHPATPPEPGVGSTGDLSLSIPVLTVPGRAGFDFAINFTYQAGIRFDQRASWIGMGWNFDPGSITRDPLGLSWESGGSITLYNVDYTAVPTWQPDAYHARFPGGSGMMTRASSATVAPPRNNGSSGFYFNDWQPWLVTATATGPVTVSGKTTKVEGNWSASKNGDRTDYHQFILTTEDGTRYVFGDTPSNAPGAVTLSRYVGMGERYDYPSYETYVSTWRLVAILAPDYTGPTLPTGTESGRWIRFKYTTALSAEETQLPILERPIAQSAYLESILTPTHEAKFTLATRPCENFALWECAHPSNYSGQPDLYSRLTSIKLYSRDAPTVVVEEVVLTHTNTIPSPNPHQISETEIKRLRLETIQIKGKNNDTTYPDYQFTYYDTEGGDFDDNDFDDFGYYNQHEAASFDLNTVDGRSWSLKKITYPTGGWEEYEYDNDQVVNLENTTYTRYAPIENPPSQTGTYSFNTSNGGKLRQGGVRVTKVTRNDGMGTSTSSQVTTFSYGNGHASGIPPIFWQRDTSVSGTNFLSAPERGHAAVYYEHVERVNPDGSKVRTWYTNPVTQSSTVKRLETTEFIAALCSTTSSCSCPGGVCANEAFILVQGNQDWNWGRPYKTTFYDNAATPRIIQESNATLDITAKNLKQAWNTPSVVNVVWGYPEKKDSETFTDKGETGTLSVVKTTTYTYDLTAGTGTGLVRKIEETHNSGTKRVREFEYAYEKTSNYGGMNTKNILNAVVREDVGSVSGTTTTYLASTITAWDEFNATPIWKPCKVYAWNATSFVTTKAAFTNWDCSTTPSGTTWQRKTTFNSYNTDGLLTSESDARSNTTTLGYNTKGQLTSVARGSLSRSFTYEADWGRLATVVDENANTTTYTYDNFGRLKEVKDRNSNKIAEHTYTFTRASDGTFTATTPNYIQTKTIAASLFGAGQNRYFTRTYLDGLGRAIQIQNWGELETIEAGPLPQGLTTSSYTVTHTEYDNMGRTWRVWKPYTRTTLGYDTGFAANARTLYGTTTNPYVETLYKIDGLGRVSQVKPENDGVTIPTVSHTYGIAAISSVNYSYTETTDEEGKKTRQYTDTFGQPKQTIAGYGATEAATTTFTYNVRDLLTQVTDPRSLNTTYSYDTQGQLVSKTSPDAGTVSFKYDAAGNLRFSQDARQAVTSVPEPYGKVSFTQYDAFDRPTLSGQATLSTAFSNLNPLILEPFEDTVADSANYLQVNTYDAKPGTTVYPWNSFASEINTATLNRLSGHLAATAYRSNAAWQLALYSYDKEERYEKKLFYMKDFVSSGSKVRSELAYTYDWLDKVLTTTATVGTNSLYQWYDYDLLARMSKSYAATTATKPATADVSYTWNAASLIASEQFQALLPTPYTYTLRGWIDQVGNPATTSYPFSANYDYFQNGNLSTAEYYNGASPAANKRYRYLMAAADYDALSRLKKADYSYYTSAWQSTLAYDVTSISYDKGGNLLTLQRYSQGATLLDNLSYSIAATSNRLSSLTDAVLNSSPTWDAETGTLSYDASGNVLTSGAPYHLSGLSYDERHLPITLTANGVLSRYRYDAAGERTYQQVGSSPARYYLRDGARLVGEFTPGGVLDHWNVFGAGLVGRLTSTGVRQYYVRDHLGSIRSVLTSSGSLVQGCDYDVWGVSMEGRCSESVGVTEGFTGKERDGTGLDCFGARYYLSAYARWGSVDPLPEQHPGWSPYTYVLDNPLRLVDPDGKAPCCLEVMTFEKAGKQYLQRQAQFQEQRDQGEYLKATATLAWAPIELALNLLGAADPMGLMGGVSTVGMADDAARLLSQADDLARVAAGERIPSLDDLSRAAATVDRGGLTAAGRALQKHGSREGSVFPSTKGNTLSINQQGQIIVDEILTSPGHTIVTREHARFGRIIEIRAPDGRGVRYGADGNFIGFLEPRK